MPENKNELQRTILNVVKDKIELFEFGTELPLGIIPCDASGHTPGHTVYRKGEFMIVGDLIHGLALQLVHPEYCATYDMDNEKSIKSRKKYFAVAKDNNLVIAGMHFPSPGFYEKI